MSDDILEIVPGTTFRVFCYTGQAEVPAWLGRVERLKTVVPQLRISTERDGVWLLTQGNAIVFDHLGPLFMVPISRAAAMFQKQSRPAEEPPIAAPEPEGDFHVYGVKFARPLTTVIQHAERPLVLAGDGMTVLQAQTRDYAVTLKLATQGMEADDRDDLEKRLAQAVSHALSIPKDHF